MQVAMELAPRVVEKVPTKHSLQRSDEEAAGARENVPARQKVQAAARSWVEKLPTTQKSQMVANNCVE
jgi:hypothetical protein